jgi:hypothetical protein
MAFIVIGGNVTSYAEAEDLKGVDQRVFEGNEINFADAPDAPGSLDEYIEDLTTKATARINEKIRASARWREYLNYAGIGFDNINNIPAFDPNKIKSRKADFTDMCCYYTLKEYLLPKVAEFGDPESPEVQKIKYYDAKFNDIFEELLAIMDYYDADGDGTVEAGEKQVRFSNPRRSRGRRRIVRVR